MKISVIGTGYVGLVAGACFADTGNDVICVDTDPKKVEDLKKGIIPIYEPGLETIVKRCADLGRLKFTTSHADAVRASEIVFMAVGTPPGPDGQADLKYLKSAAESVAKAMDGYRLIVNKSTVPIGTHLSVQNWMKPHTQHPFDVCSNPEFLKEGSAIEDFLKPDRVVIGTEKQEVFEKMRKLYMPFVRQGNPIIHMDTLSAEITKYACNAFLATRISFMNELALLCDKVGGDVESVRRGMTTDVRIGKHFLYAGVGYGGSCFPKDVQALIHTANQHDLKFQIVEAAEAANARQKSVLVDKVKKRFGESLAGKTFCIWGLAFKPNTDDMREAPALIVIENLIKLGAKIRCFDPVAMPNTKEILAKYKDQITYCASSLEAAQSADAVLLVTEWNEFRHMDFTAVAKTVKSKIVFDGRNIYMPNEIKDAGFEYFGIGRR